VVDIIVDIYSKEKRSKIMSKIRGTETKPEILVRKFLFSKGFRYRINDKRYPGKPDIVLPKYRTAIFVHGCFWHGHENCKAAALPKTNRSFWESKIRRNVDRDQKNIELLEKDDWNVIVVWNCQIKTKKNGEQRLDLLVKEIKG
jgi:DNA mismatch endonuclease Vsr